MVKVQVARVFHEDEADTLETSIKTIEHRLKYTHYLMKSDKLDDRARKIVGREREALEWLLPRLRRALVELTADGDGSRPVVPGRVDGRRDSRDRSVQ